MRKLLFAAAIAMTTAVGCQSEPGPKMEGEAPPVKEGEGIEVQAPGVDVKVGGGDGVEVKAPGADVEVKQEPE